QRCRLGGAMTLIPGEVLEDVMTEFAIAVQQVADADPWLCDHRPQLDWLAGVSGAETRETSAIYRCTASTLRHLGASPRINPLHTSSDIRNPIVQKNIPTVGFGPLCGNLAMCGLTDEWVSIESYQRAIEAVACIIAEWCGVESVR
ncbi:MAG: hypothetical protein AAFY56_13965, partial [Pseudomonadota bacterium]